MRPVLAWVGLDPEGIHRWPILTEAVPLPTGLCQGKALGLALGLASQVRAPSNTPTHARKDAETEPMKNGQEGDRLMQWKSCMLPGFTRSFVEAL